MLELCTGAGHIGLLAVHASGRRLVAVDADPGACAWARHNAAANGIHADIRHGDIAEVLDDDELFPLIVADPPWVRRGQVDRYPEDPRTAIDGGPDGLALARRCLQVIADHLLPRGAALLQLGSPGQVENLGGDLEQLGLVAGEHLLVPENGTVVLLRHRDG